ncbi:PadR family transcriptional regulator [candidate division KSB1 bacterium]
MYLSRMDEILLLTIWRLGDNAYGVPIIKEIKESSGKKISLGGLWVLLDVLCKKGFLEKRIADPTPERGGRGKIYYTITEPGIKELGKVREMSTSLWSDLPDTFLEKLKKL